MTAAYKTHQVAANRRRPKVLTARERRPNPFVPVEAEIEAAAREVHAAIVADPAALEMLMAPVTTIAEPIVRRRFARFAPELRGLCLAEVVECVLADPAARLALAQLGMHVA